MTTDYPTIRRTGVLFRPGCYGKKGDYTESDLSKLVIAAPVPIRMSHHPTLLDGKLGYCERTWVGFDDSGHKVLMGEWHEPQPLADLLGDAPRTLSVEINLPDKTLRAVALEVNPHIEGTAFSNAVEAAYAAFSAGEKVTPLAGAVDWEEVNLARREAGLPPRDFCNQVASHIIERRKREAQPQESKPHIVNTI